MDGVALASVITSSVPVIAVIAAIGVAVWTARQSAKLARESARESVNLARETRVQQRLGESYLEVLRIVEREAQWVEARVTNLKLAVEEAQINCLLSDPRDYLARFEQVVKVPEEPAVTDRATIAAHLAAFGSANVRELYRVWRSTITEIDIEKDRVREAFDGKPGEAPGLGVLKNLKVLQPTERDVRQALADVIADELGHR